MSDSLSFDEGLLTEACTPEMYDLKLKFNELKAENERLKKDAVRYKWLAPKLLASDYGDNDLPGEQVGWRIDPRYTESGRNPVVVSGPSIDSAIDLAMSRQIEGANNDA